MVRTERKKVTRRDGMQLAKLINHIRRGRVQATLKERGGSFPELASGEKG